MSELSLPSFALYFLQYRQAWYTRRLQEETKPEARAFIRATLHNINQQLQTA